jgi:hypothetical protein
MLDNGGNGFVTRLGNWAAVPIISGIDAGTLSLFILLLISVSWLWNEILRDIVQNAVKEIVE